MQYIQGSAPPSSCVHAFSRVQLVMHQGRVLVLQDMEMPAALKEADSTREAQLLESWKAYKKGFQEGISIFNKKPKKGIAFMQVQLLAYIVLPDSP